MGSHPPTLEFDVIAGSSHSGRAMQQVLFWGLCTLLASAILALGSTRDWGIFILQFGAVALFLVWAVAQITARELRVPKSPLLWPMLGLWLLVWVQWLFRTTVYANATRGEGLLWTAYGFLFLVGGSVLSRESGIRRFLTAITAFGGALAIFAIVQSLTSGGRIYWLIVVNTVAQPYGPYINHSHYAGLMEMLAPFGVVLCLNPHLSGARRVLAGFSGLLMSASIVFSRSRGGMVALACELAFLGGFLLLASRRRKGLGWQAGILATALIAAIVWIGPSDLLEHMATLKAPLSAETTGDRLTIVKDSVRMWRDRPLLGWGLDVFPIVYPKYRSFATNYRINAAHNDYIQLLVEMGAVGFAVMLVLVFFIYRKAFRNLQESTSPFRSDAVLAALVGLTGLLVHSLSDFNLHIPANAAVFFVLCAVATVTPVSQSGGSQRFQVGGRRHSRRRESRGTAAEESTPLLIEGYREDD